MVGNFFQFDGIPCIFRCVENFWAILVFSSCSFGAAACDMHICLACIGWFGALHFTCTHVEKEKRIPGIKLNGSREIAE